MSDTSGRNRTNLLLASALVLFSGLLFRGALDIPPPFFDPLGSAAVPKLVAGVLLVLALVLGASAVFDVRAEEPAGPMPAAIEADEKAEPASPVTAAAAVLINAAYVGSMHARLLDFAAASTLFVLALGMLLARGRMRALLVLVPLALLLGYGFEWLFTRVLFIDLPQRSILLEGLSGG